MKQKLVILHNQTTDQRFLGITLEVDYDVGYINSFEEAIRLANNGEIDGFLFDLPPSGLINLKQFPLSVRLFCVVSPTREPPFIPEDSPMVYFIPLPFNRMELQAIMQKAFQAKPSASTAAEQIQVIAEPVTEKVYQPSAVEAPPAKVEAEVPVEELELEADLTEAQGEAEAEEVTVNAEQDVADIELQPQNESAKPPATVNGLVLSSQQVKPATTTPFSLVHNTVLDLVHSVKNPLVSIQTFAQMLPEKIDDSEFRENFSRFVTSEINLINTRLNQFLEKTSLPLFTKEKFAVETFIKGVEQKLAYGYPQLRFEVEAPPQLLIQGNCEKLTEAVTTIWSIILEMVEKPQIFFINCGLVTCQLQAETPSQNYLELYFTLKFKPQYIDMELDFLSTAQRPKGVEILYALRLIEEMSGSLNITKADKNTFTVKISLPVCAYDGKVEQKAAAVSVEE